MNWQIASLIVLGLVLAAGFLWYERSRPPAKVLSLVAALAALAVVGRLAFAAFPNVKPTTDIVLFAGYALGSVAGFSVGAVTALASNVFLSQGPWTPWQMAGWGAVGVGGALLARAAGGRELGRVPLALACGLAGVAFGALLDVYQWTLAARQDLDSYLAVSASSLPYNVAHAVGNVVFCLAIGPPFIRALRRYRRRFEVSWPQRPAAGARAGAPAVGAVVAALILTGGLAAAPAAEAASASKRAARYLKRAQNRDGGFGPARGAASNQLHTGWAALGLGAAGHNPRDVRRRGGRSITRFVRRRAGALNDTGELERTILVLKVAGLSPRRFAGRNLVAQLRGRRRPSGSWGGTINLTAFGVLALRAAGEPAGSARIQESASWLARRQNGDGGFGFVASAGSDVDDTGAVLQALAAAGRRGSHAVDRAVRYLRRRQRGDGGFGQMRGSPSNAQSTAWAVQGLVAARVPLRTVSRNGRTPIAYLKSLQRRNGSIRYSRYSRQTPVWVTAQALTALKRKAFPLRRVKRRRASAAAAAASASEGASGDAGSGSDGRESRSSDSAEQAQAGADGGSTVVGSERASDGAQPQAAPGGREGGPSAVLFIAGGGGALALVWLVRRRLRRRRPAAA